MKKTLIYIILLFFLLWIPSQTKALFCKYPDLSKFNNIASNVNLSYDAVENENGVSFQVTISNLRPEIYMTDLSTGRIFENVGSEITLSGYQPGQTVRYEFKTRDRNCSDHTLSVKYISFPTYNSFYQSEACLGIEDYKLCQKWYSHQLTYDNFLKEIAWYKASINKPDVPIPKVETTFTFFDFLARLFERYYFLLFGGIVLIGGTVLVIYYKKNNFKF